jgi:hypothetical protein
MINEIRYHFSFVQRYGMVTEPLVEKSFLSFFVLTGFIREKKPVDRVSRKRSRAH